MTKIKMNSLLKSLQSFLMIEPMPFSTKERLRSGVGAFIAIALAGAISAYFLSGMGLPLLIASIGASTALVFAAPHSPLAQPWPVLAGNLISAVVGVTCAQWVNDPMLAASLAVSLAIVAMLLTHSLHPPGGGVALLAVLGGGSIKALGYQLLLPFALNLLVLLISAMIFNNIMSGRRYPMQSHRMRDEIHKHDDPTAMQRVGISQDDLHQALKHFDSYIDVSEVDLDEIYKLAGMRSYQRKMGEILCADIMSRDLITAEYGTELEDAWAQLRFHKIKAMPVVDRAQRVIGIITLVDFLKRADLKTYATFQEKLVKFIRRSSCMTSDKPEVVGQIMATPVFTARDDAHIVELVPLLSEQGLHHIPIVNAEKRLVGMVTQSDLIAALYAGNARV